MIDFVLLATQRTGSYMLVSALDNHPRVCCHGELFRKKNLHLATDLSFLDQIDPAYKDYEFRRDNFQEYLQLVKKVDGSKDLFGFKLMLGQAKRVRETLIQDVRIKKILLYRDNLLAVYASNRIAKATGQGIVHVGDELKQAKVDFDPKQFERFRERIDLLYKQVREQLKVRPRNEWMETQYPDICRDEEIARVMRFIGAEPGEAPISVRTVKRNTGNILDRFTNPKDVLTHLEKVKRMDWVRESQV